LFIFCQFSIGVNSDIFLQGEMENAEFHGEKIDNNFDRLLRETLKLCLLRTSLLKKNEVDAQGQLTVFYMLNIYPCT